MSCSQTRSSIRQEKRRLRLALTDSIQKQHAQQLQQQLICLPSYRNSQHIACYLANDGEISTTGIIEHAWQMHKTVYLPVLSPLKNSLYFAPYNKNSQLKKNRFGINEPDCQPSQWRKAWQLNLLLLPLVAFDRNGNRMGMGGGFYDRTLAYHHRMRHWKKPRLIGLAHEIQHCEILDQQSWDIPLDAIATETTIYNMRL